ncbi:unnamed protein product, partial [Didymodactylos carnosus]
VQYEGVSPSHRSTPLSAVLGGQVEMECLARGGDGMFDKWYKEKDSDDDIPVEQTSGHYDVKQGTTAEDFDATGWYVSTNANDRTQKPSECRFGQIQRIPSPVRITTNKDKEIVDKTYGSITRVENELLNLTCVTSPPNQTVEWWYSSDDRSYEKLSKNVEHDNNMDNTNTISIKDVGKKDMGHYRCSIGNATFTANLRVKDKMAALWPFIGIVAVVSVLVIVILIFERRQKLKRKA